MQLFKRYGQALHLLKRNLPAIVEFEVLYKILSALVVLPVIYGLMRLSYFVAGINYLSNDTIKKYLLNPFTIIGIFIILLLMTFVSLFDIEAVICCYHASYYDTKITVSQMFDAGLKKAGRVFHKKNWMLILFVILIVPLTNVAAVSGFVSSIKIPEFILDFIIARKALCILCLVGVVILVLIAFQWAFIFHSIAIENLDFGEARVESQKIMKHNYIRVALGTVLWQFLLQLAAMVLGAAVCAVAFVIIKLFWPSDLQFLTSSTFLLIVVAVIETISFLLAVPFAFAYLSSEYYGFKNKNSLGIEEAQEFRMLRINKVLRIVIISVIAVALVGNVTILASQQVENEDAARSILNRPQIAAHRGSSANAPENNIPAFQKAIEDGADWIELDVHQTSDNVVVVTHDSNVKRITGVDKEVWEMTYDELEQLDAGSWFSDEFKGLKVATLDEVLKLCKGKIKVNIELKPTGHEENFEQNVMDVISANGYKQDQYILASLNADTLKNIKAIDPSQKTLFIMSIAAGDVLSISFADAFSIEESSINEKLVNSIHEAGKEVYAWTVNREENAKEMINLRVDCILTDNPLMVEQVLDSKDLHSWTDSVVGMFFTKPEVVDNPDIANSP